MRQSGMPGLTEPQNVMQDVPRKMSARKHATGPLLGLVVHPEPEIRFDQTGANRTDLGPAPVAKPGGDEGPREAGALTPAAAGGTAAAVLNPCQPPRKRYARAQPGAEEQKRHPTGATRDSSLLRRVPCCVSVGGYGYPCSWRDHPLVGLVRPRTYSRSRGTSLY